MTLQNSPKSGKNAGSRVQEAAAGRAGAAGARIRKEKNGLLDDYSSPEVGFGGLHCICPVSLTPNSETPLVLWLGPWSMELAGQPGRPGKPPEVYPQVSEIRVDLNLDS